MRDISIIKEELITSHTSQYICIKYIGSVNSFRPQHDSSIGWIESSGFLLGCVICSLQPIALENLHWHVSHFACLNEPFTQLLVLDVIYQYIRALRRVTLDLYNQS